ncbi:TIGR01841 family phasin [Paraburkholderia caledonica]|jgi:phasin family protein|uniref:TIGR01841 family phasin n=1 Tax=Paraburkholderia caledonica TaxID=134536 RepID=UPI0038BC6C5C
MNFVAAQQTAFGLGAWLEFEADFLHSPPFVTGAVMNTVIPHQFVEAQTPNVQQLFGLSNSAFAGLEKLTALNLQAIKVTLAENQAIMMKAVSARPEELFVLSTSLAKPMAEKVSAYSRQVYEILSGIQGGLSSTAQSQFQQYQRGAHVFVENLAKNAPLETDIPLSE